MPMIQVSAVRPSNIPAGMEEVFSRVKDADKKNIPVSQRVRSILIPELEVAAGVSSKFQSLLLDSLRRLAREQLGVLRKSGCPTEVHSSLFTVDGLLEFYAREVESTRLSGESIEAAAKLLGFVDGLLEEHRAPAMEVLKAAWHATSRAKIKEKQAATLSAKLAEFLARQPGDENEKELSILDRVCQRLAEHAEAKRIEREAFETESGF